MTQHEAERALSLFIDEILARRIMSSCKGAVLLADASVLASWMASSLGLVSPQKGIGGNLCLVATFDHEAPTISTRYYIDLLLPDGSPWKSALDSGLISIAGDSIGSVLPPHLKHSLFDKLRELGILSLLRL
jgi:hypothetical protein